MADLIVHRLRRQRPKRKSGSSIADPVHGLLLTPDPIERGFIY